MKLIFTLLVMIPYSLFGQVQIERQVISSLGLNYGGNIQFSSTAGQVENTTFIGPNHILNQGFEQGDLNPKSLHYTLESPACDNGDPWLLYVSIDSVCIGNSGQVFINEIEEEEWIEITTPGTYDIQVACNSGSNYYASVIVEDVVLPGCNLIFYNVLTPSSTIYYWPIDNIDGEGFANNRVSIFNRWGVEIWKGENYDNMDVRWEGLDSNGEILPQGTYYYLVEIGEETHKGFIELIR